MKSKYLIYVKGLEEIKNQKKKWLIINVKITGKILFKI